MPERYILRDLSESLHQALRSSLTCSCRHDIGLGPETREVGALSWPDEQRMIGLNSFKISACYNIAFEPLEAYQDFRLEPQRLSSGPLPP